MEKLREQRQKAVTNAAESSQAFVKSFKNLTQEYKQSKNMLDKVAQNSKQAKGNLQAISASNDYLYLLNKKMDTLIATMQEFTESYNNMTMLQLEENLSKFNKNQQVLGEKIDIKMPADSKLYFTDISTTRK